MRLVKLAMLDDIQQTAVRKGGKLQLGSCHDNRQAQLTNDLALHSSQK